MNPKLFKIRSSAIGQIMTNPRSKSETLSKTTQTFCQTWLMEQIYDRTKEFQSKYTEKGLLVENEGIELLSEYKSLGMVLKNLEWYHNDFMTGSPDVVLPDMVIDVKSSWDCFTFPLFDPAPAKDYWWQVQGYMELADKDKAWIAYVLLDTPDEIIQREINSMMWKLGLDEIDEELEEQVYYRMRYNNLPIDKRVKIYEVDRDREAIKQVAERVELCREYISTLI